jgi:hypothetical protein
VAEKGQVSPDTSPEAAAHPAQRWGALYGLLYQAARWLVIYQRLDGVWCVAAIYGQRDDAEAQLDALTGRAGRRQGERTARPAIPMAGQIDIFEALQTRAAGDE